MRTGIVLGNMILNIGVGGILSSIYDIPSIYSALRVPPLSPPSYIFPIVWVFMYTLISFAVSSLKNEWLILLYYTQLVLNFMWIPAFFGFGYKSFSAVIIFVIEIICCIICLLDKSVIPYLLPYILWLAFALYLNLWTEY